MLVIKIELWPGGRKDLKRDMGTMFIVNSGAGTRAMGVYEVMMSKWRKPEEPYRIGVVSGFDRINGSPWELMRRAIVAATDQRRVDAGLRQKMIGIARRALRGQQDMFSAPEQDDGDEDYGKPDLEP